MAITIREIKVLTTVTRGESGGSGVSEERLRELKQEILAEIKRMENRKKRKRYER